MSVYKHDTSNAPSPYPQQCNHGYCLHHNPQWERAGDVLFTPKPLVFLWFKLHTYRCHFHCGNAMERMSKYVMQRCRLCGRQEKKLLEESIAYCICCGYHFRHSTTFAQLVRDRNEYSPQQAVPIVTAAELRGMNPKEDSKLK